MRRVSHNESKAPLRCRPRDGTVSMIVIADTLIARAIYHDHEKQVRIKIKSMR